MKRRRSCDRGSTNTEPIPKGGGVPQDIGDLGGQVFHDHEQSFELLGTLLERDEMSLHRERLVGAEGTEREERKVLSAGEIIETRAHGSSPAKELRSFASPDRIRVLIVPTG